MTLRTATTTRLLRLQSTPSSRLAHTVRVLVRNDLPEGKAYKDDVLDVKAGYARNFLIPQKYAVYATQKNLDKYGVEDTKEERVVDVADQDQRAADLLKNYLRNKTLQIRRNVVGEEDIHPGMVDAKAVRKKLAKHLKIDLEPHERIHIHPEPITGDNLHEHLESLPHFDAPCTVQLKKLGDYVARISLRGGYTVPLALEVVKR